MFFTMDARRDLASQPCDIRRDGDNPLTNLAHHRPTASYDVRLLNQRRRKRLL